MKPLTPEERRVIVDKGTEAPFTGEYDKHFESGTYCCRQCGAPLYRSADKFDGHCGWPSFDDAIDGAVTRTPDPDGRRTEITCTACGGHLGHVFEGENFTWKDTRHCVNSVSMVFRPASEQPSEDQTLNQDSAAHTAASQAAQSIAPQALETAIFAGGCFWGVEHLMAKEPGVVRVHSGYTGGHKRYPTYEEMKTQATGHAEAVRVLYDPAKTTYERLARLFFEIHDPTQTGGQGPDLGDQYRSAIFYETPEQQQTALRLIDILRSKGYDVVTDVEPATRFWPAEEYHQRYYERKGTEPYCHIYTKRF